jgi:molybdate transport system ATP-binding protein
MIKVNLVKTFNPNKNPFSIKISTTIQSSRITTIYGESGAGKSTILRMIAGLCTPDQGSITVDNEIWYDSAKKINLPPQERKLGFMFQDYALFPNMSVLKNLEFALESKKTQKAQELLSLMRLTPLAHLYPNQLSGGQKQRVALARAVIREPKLLLLDEPLSALDYQKRADLQNYLLLLQEKFAMKILLISHDLSEIFKLSEQVLHIHQGKLIGTGTPAEIFQAFSLDQGMKMSGKLLHKEYKEFYFILTIQVGKDIVQLLAGENEGLPLEIGQTVLLVDKSLSPTAINLLPGII